MQPYQPLILHIPHSSTLIPVPDGFVVSEDQLKEEILKLTDWFTDDLFSNPIDESVVAPFSRIFCDVERFEDDRREVMVQFGMGMLYTHLDSGEEMREVSDDLRKTIIDGFYRPHHQRLIQSVEKVLDRFRKCTIIDCHSFPNIPLNRSLNTKTPRPHFNIGTDSFHTPPEYIDLSMNFFRNKGYTLGLDWPYNGALVPMKFYQKDKRVKSIMLEVNRDLYLKPGSSERSEQYLSTKGVIQEFIEVIRIL